MHVSFHHSIFSDLGNVHEYAPGKDQKPFYNHTEFFPRHRSDSFGAPVYMALGKTQALSHKDLWSLPRAYSLSSLISKRMSLRKQVTHACSAVRR